MGCLLRMVELHDFLSLRRVLRQIHRIGMELMRLLLLLEPSCFYLAFGVDDRNDVFVCLS